MTLQQARRFALSLPETTEEPHHEMSSFRVCGKIFATVPPDGLRIHVFVDDPQREAAIVVAPEAIEKLWWGSQVRGVRVLLAKAKSDLVSELLYSAWSRKAPPPVAKSFVNPFGAAK